MNISKVAANAARAFIGLLSGVAIALVVWSPNLSSAELTAQQKQQIAALARYVQYQEDPIAIILRSYGFPPVDWGTDDWRGWSTWTGQEKLTAAYLAAENGGSAAQADELLRAVTQRLQKMNAAVGQEPALQTLLSQPVSTNGNFKYAFVNRHAVDAAKLPPEVRNVVERLALHAAPLRSLSPIAAVCCKLDAQTSKEWAANSKDLSDYLEHVITGTPVPPELEEKIARMADFIVHQNASLAFDDVFAKSQGPLRERAKDYSTNSAGFPGASREDISFKPAANEDAIYRRAAQAIRTQTAGGSGDAAADADKKRTLTQIANALDDQPPPTGGGGGLPRSGTSRMYDAFGSASYGRDFAGDMGLARMRMMSGGFGGVIFGATVSRDPKLPDVVSLTFVPRENDAKSGAGDGAWGHLELVFADGSRGFSGPVRAQHAVTAQRLVFDQASFAKGAAVGLAGYDGPAFQAHVDATTGFVDRDDSPGFSFIIAPAIERMNLARCLMVIDASGFVPEFQSDIQSTLKQQKISVADSSKLRAWFTIRKGQYKFTDMPVIIKRNPAGLIMAVPVASGSARLHAQNGVFLDFQALVPETDPDEEASPEKKARNHPTNQAFINRQMAQLLPTVLPLLLRGSSEYREVNDFVEVVDIFRYVKDSGGIVTSRIQSPQSAYPYGSVFVVGENRYQFGPPATMLELRLLDDVQAYADKVAAGGTPAIAALNKDMYKWSSSFASVSVARHLMTLASISPVAQQYEASATAASLSVSDPPLSSPEKQIPALLPAGVNPQTLDAIRAAVRAETEDELDLTGVQFLSRFDRVDKQAALNGALVRAVKVYIIWASYLDAIFPS
jgi:hypothetical protein